MQLLCDWSTWDLKEFLFYSLPVGKNASKANSNCMMHTAFGSEWAWLHRKNAVPFSINETLKLFFFRFLNCLHKVSYVWFEQVDKLYTQGKLGRKNALAFLTCIVCSHSKHFIVFAGLLIILCKSFLNIKILYLISGVRKSVSICRS